MADAKLIEFLQALMPYPTNGSSILLSHFQHSVLQKGEKLLQAGAICLDFFFVESGHLRTYFDKAGEEVNMYIHLEGSITSDHKNGKAGIPSPFTIVAGEKSEIWTLNREVLTSLCYSHPEIMEFGRRLVVRLLMDQNAHSQLFKMYAPVDRYYYIVENNPELLQRVSLSNLASYLGMNRRTLTRIRSKK